MIWVHQNADLDYESNSGGYGWKPNNFTDFTGNHYQNVGGQAPTVIPGDANYDHDHDDDDRVDHEYGDRHHVDRADKYGDDSR